MASVPSHSPCSERTAPVTVSACSRKAGSSMVVPLLERTTMVSVMATESEIELFSTSRRPTTESKSVVRANSLLSTPASPAPAMTMAARKITTQAETTFQGLRAQVPARRARVDGFFMGLWPPSLILAGFPGRFALDNRRAELTMSKDAGASAQPLPKSSLLSSHHAHRIPEHPVVATLDRNGLPSSYQHRMYITYILMPMLSLK